MNQSVKQLSHINSNDLFSGNQTLPKRFRSPLRYPGGKQKALDKIFTAFPKSATEYREPMVGGGSVFFQAFSLNFAKHYWINDKFTELISFWQTVQDPDECSKLINALYQLHTNFTSADEIKQYFHSSKNKQAVDSFEQAFLFFFFNRVTFSGTTRAGGFSSAASQSRFTTSSIERLVSMPEALVDVKITNLSFEDVIKEPGEDVFIFLDPPYYTASKLYGHGGSLHHFDHEQLAHMLKQTSHRFLITYDDCNEIRSLYKWAKVESWSLQYGMNNCNLSKESKIGSELFICNY